MWFTCYLQTSSINSKSIKSQDTHKHIPVLTFLFNLTCSKRTRLDRRILVLVSAPGNRRCVEHRRVACRNTRYAPVFPKPLVQCCTERLQVWSCDSSSVLTIYPPQLRRWMVHTRCCQGPAVRVWGVERSPSGVPQGLRNEGERGDLGFLLEE